MAAKKKSQIKRVRKPVGAATYVIDDRGGMQIADGQQVIKIERDLVLLMFGMVFAIGQYTRAPVLKIFGVDEKATRELILEERKKAREVAKLDVANPAGKAKPAKKARAQFMQPMTPSAELAAIVGDKAQARTEVSSKIWGHIKKHGLQDKTDRRMINPDAKLAAVFGSSKAVSMFDMTKKLAKQLTPA